MNWATPQMRNFAERLMVYEAQKNVASKPKLPAGFDVAEKLRRHLATFLGKTGFHTLLARALALAAAEVPWLRGVRVKADDALEGLEEFQMQLNRDELFEGGVVLLARLLGLLVTFIGAALTVRLVREVWPKVPLDDLDFSAEGKNEHQGKNEKVR